ncbi:hypothetical protein BH20PSE1_BH20PSE1_07020 [soil metagenome]
MELKNGSAQTLPMSRGPPTLTREAATAGKRVGSIRLLGGRGVVREDNLITRHALLLPNVQHCFDFCFTKFRQLFIDFIPW